jgi:hypothetical protein
VLVAGAPAWLADNITLISLGLLALSTFVVFRFARTTASRLILLSLLAMVALFVYVNRDALKACAENCECEVADQAVNVPFCDPVDLTALARSGRSPA